MWRSWPISSRRAKPTAITTATTSSFIDTRPASFFLFLPPLLHFVTTLFLLQFVKRGGFQYAESFSGWQCIGFCGGRCGDRASRATGQIQETQPTGNREMRFAGRWFDYRGLFESSSQRTQDFWRSGSLRRTVAYWCKRSYDLRNHCRRDGGREACPGRKVHDFYHPQQGQVGADRQQKNRRKGNPPSGR